MDRELNEEELQDLYAWIDKIPLSRPKRHITRDFSDGVMAAEVVKYYFPKFVDLHNYVPANGTPQKLSNWDLLNRKVFSKLNFQVTEDTVNKIVLNTPGAIEPVLSILKKKIERRPEQPNNTLDLEYYDTQNHEKIYEETFLNEVKVQTEQGKKTEEKGKQKKSKEQLKVNLNALDSDVRQMVKEKDKEVLSLRETVEILQVKVSKLEHLVRLKDLRIEELTRHLDTYKAKGSNPK
ncbi:sperm flagellar protein 1 [Boleophthalmus pectinirostris]|uniref:sperm flagellar protein 1 n=1 Tax=Boleophthalmus pectinirostris TaxID=150288 RepID=UPI000A1C6501|nr:sperm flagellar protein 1 [Boleophthalmus pectinirostris]